MHISKHSEETKEKIRQSLLGVKHTPERCLKASLIRLGKKLPRINGTARPGNNSFDKLIRYKYNITEDQYNEMLKNQNGLCELCGKPETFKYKGTLRRLCIDHDHSSGKIRGLLCNTCNKLLGVYESINPKFDAYIEKYKIK